MTRTTLVAMMVANKSRDAGIHSCIRDDCLKSAHFVRRSMTVLIPRSLRRTSLSFTEASSNTSCHVSMIGVV